MIKKLDTIERNKCILTGNRDLNVVYTFKNFPVFCGCMDTNDNDNDDLFCDMSWSISKSSGIIQLNKLIPLDFLYSVGHNSGSIGKVWKDHHENFSAFIKKGGYNKVLEIGGATGNLFNNFLNEDGDFSWSIIEPRVELKVEDQRLKFLEGFLERYDFGDQKFDTIVHSHVLEHTYNPLDFVEKISDLISPGGKQYISIPNMKHALEMGYMNMLTFEHSYFIDIDLLICILAKNKFVVDKIFENNHSIFVKSHKVDYTPKVKDYFSSHKNLFMVYIDNIKKDVIRINESIISSDQIFLFGGHVWSQYLLSMGLNMNIISILDNDIDKQGKRLYGTNLIVENPKVLYNYIEPKVIIRAGVYSEEIKDQLLSINSNTKFL